MRAVRQRMVEYTQHAEPYFHWRGGDVSRLEGLADAVFAFAVTLIVVSLEAPSSVEEFFTQMKGFPAFAGSFFLLYWIWHAHYLFFRRFGLQDFMTRTLNCCLLFTVLFYIYPMKFVIGAAIQTFSGGDMSGTNRQIQTLMWIYSSGLLAIFGLIVLLYVHAYRRRKLLELSELEAWTTRASIGSYLIPVGVAVVSMAINFYSSALAGMVFFAVGPLAGIYGWRSGVAWTRQVEKLEAAEAAQA